jgi:hypothetical protein
MEPKKLCEFPFVSGVWLSRGKLCLAGVEQDLTFYAKWSASELSEGTVGIVRRIEVVGLSEPISSHYVFSRKMGLKSVGAFYVQWSGSNLDGLFQGHGNSDHNGLIWQVEGDEGLQSCRVILTRQGEEYHYREEFSHGIEGELTILEGRLWPSRIH